MGTLEQEAEGFYAKFAHAMLSPRLGSPSNVRSRRSDGWTLYPILRWLEAAFHLRAAKADSTPMAYVRATMESSLACAPCSSMCRR